MLKGTKIVEALYSISEAGTSPKTLAKTAKEYM